MEDISAVLSVDLAYLGQKLYSPDGDLDDSVRSLKRDAALAVRSLLGLTLRVTVQDQPVTLASIEEWVEPSDIRSSLEISVVNESPKPTTSVMTFYAEKPNAFTELATDLSLELAVNPTVATAMGETSVRIDVAMEPALLSGLTGLPELSTLNQAVGVLIAKGHSPEGALDYLEECASSQNERLHVATEILAVARSR